MCLSNVCTLYALCVVVCMQAVKKRLDLKLIITSATLDAVKFSSYFYEAVSTVLHLCMYVGTITGTGNLHSQPGRERLLAKAVALIGL